VRGLADLDRRQVRANFERRFSVARQAAEYERIYRRLIQERQGPVAALPRAGAGDGPSTDGRGLAVPVLHGA